MIYMQHMYSYNIIIIPLSRAHQVPLLDLDKFFEEITLDVVYHNDSRPLQTHSPPKEDDSSSRYCV